jgi:hypothetical protein
MQKVNSLILLGAVGLICLFGMPSASGQSIASEAKVYVSVPSGPVEIGQGQDHAVPVRVTLVLSNIECTGEAKTSLTLSAADDGAPVAGVMVHGFSGKSEFTIPAGTYQSVSPVGAAVYNRTNEIEASIMVTNSAPDNHDHAFEFIATFEGGTPTGCQAGSAPNRASASARHAIHIPAATTPTPTNSTDSGPPEIADGEPTPGLPALTLVFATVVAVLVFRRRA